MNGSGGLRTTIAAEAARLLQQGMEKNVSRARRRAARALGVRVRSADLPTTREIRLHLDRLAEACDPADIAATPRDARLEAYRWLQLLHAYHAVYVEPTDIATRAPAQIEIHACAPDRWSIWHALPMEALADGDSPASATAGDTPWALAFHGDLPIRLLVHAEAESLAAVSRRPEFAVWTAAALREQLADQLTESEFENELAGLDPGVDRFAEYAALLENLDAIRPPKEAYPQGSLLAHSLQVFERLFQAAPHDEELLTAGLLHEVGWATNPRDPRSASADLLAGLITHRTAALILALDDAVAYQRRELAASRRAAFEQAEDFEELLLLADADTQGHERRPTALGLAEALAYLAALDDGSMWDGLDDAE